MSCTLNFDCNTVLDFMVINGLASRNYQENLSNYLWGEGVRFTTPFQFFNRPSKIIIYYCPTNDSIYPVKVSILTLNCEGNQLGVDSMIHPFVFNVFSLKHTIFSLLESLENHPTFYSLADQVSNWLCDLGFSKVDNGEFKKRFPFGNIVIFFNSSINNSSLIYSLDSLEVVREITYATPFLSGLEVLKNSSVFQITKIKCRDDLNAQVINPTICKMQQEFKELQEDRKWF